MSQDVRGVNCDICGEEVFRVFKMCMKCGGIVLDAYEQAVHECPEKLPKKQQIALNQIKSREWAEFFDGRRVEVGVCEAPGREECGVVEGFSLTGIATRIGQRTDGKDRLWGRIEVLLDPGQNPYGGTNLRKDFYYRWAAHGYEIKEDKANNRFTVIVGWSYHWLVKEQTGVGG